MKTPAKTLSRIRNPLLYPAELRAQNERAEYVGLESEIQQQRAERIPHTVYRASPFRSLCALLDLFQTWIAIADPIPRLIDLCRINWNRARNFFASRH